MLRNQPPAYEKPPPWVSPEERLYHGDYSNDLEDFLPRSVMLRRSGFNESLGFNIRGGVEYHCGLYISKVMSGTTADRVGLREGDQILKVNDVDFLNIDHSEAVKVLKAYLDVHLVVRYFPYGYQKTYDRSSGLAPSMNQNEARYPDEYYRSPQQY